MPKSKQHQARKMKLQKKEKKREKWVNRKVAAYNALPEDARLGLLAKWGVGKKKEKTGLLASPLPTTLPTTIDQHNHVGTETIKDG